MENEGLEMQEVISCKLKDVFGETAEVKFKNNGELYITKLVLYNDDGSVNEENMAIYEEAKEKYDARCERKELKLRLVACASAFLAGSLIISKVSSDFEARFNEGYEAGRQSIEAEYDHSLDDSLDTFLAGAATIVGFTSGIEFCKTVKELKRKKKNR